MSQPDISADLQPSAFNASEIMKGCRYIIEGSLQKRGDSALARFGGEASARRTVSHALRKRWMASPAEIREDAERAQAVSIKSLGGYAEIRQLIRWGVQHELMSTPVPLAAPTAGEREQGQEKGQQ